jgi:hypothetical protein
MFAYLFLVYLMMLLVSQIVINCWMTDKYVIKWQWCRSQSWWPCDLRHRSAGASLLGSRVPILLGAWMFVTCSVGSGLCDELIRTLLSVCVCLIVCDLETSTMRRPGPELGCSATEKDVQKEVDVS